MAGKVSKGTSWSADVSEPCMPISADSRGSAFVATTADGPAGATTTSPIPLLIGSLPRCGLFSGEPSGNLGRPA
jgi:hypothetical protein